MLKPSSYLKSLKMPQKVKMAILYRLIDYFLGHSLIELKWAIECETKGVKK